MKIVILDGYTMNPGDLSWMPISEQGDLIVYDRTAPSEIIERVGDAEYVFLNKTPMDADTISKIKHVKFIGVLATGFNIVDIEAAKAHGITVCNVPAYSTDSVAQLVFAFILEIAQNAALYSKSVFAGDWANCADFCYYKAPLFELSGRTLGIIGFGTIGKAVAKIAQAFGMQVIATARKPIDQSYGVSGVSLDELLQKSDIITVHTPLVKETEKLINRENIAKMKDGVIFINTSRGPVVDEAALTEALNSGKIRAAGVDVVSREPISADNPLLKAKNLLITPHIGWATKEARERCIAISANTLKKFLDNAPVNVVSL